MGERASRRRFLGQLLPLAAMANARQLAAQTRGPSFRSDVELVTTPVTVRDAGGRLVATLGRDDFTVRVDGREQPLAQFTRERVPVSVALVLDVSDSMRGPRMQEARTALTAFLSDLLAPEDEVCLVTFHHQALVAARWTRERPAIEERLARVRPFGGTALYDAIATALPLFRERQHTRGAMVLVSDGADTASDLSLAQVRSALTGSDVFVYAIALEAGGRGSTLDVNPYALRDVTGRGGGYTEVITAPADLGPATARIADELNHQYVLGFSHDREPDGRFHSIRVSVTDAAHQVRARRGFVAAPQWRR